MKGKKVKVYLILQCQIPINGFLNSDLFQLEQYDSARFMEEKFLYGMIPKTNYVSNCGNRTSSTMSLLPQ